MSIDVSVMQELMMGHLALLGSPVPSASGSTEPRGSTDPDPKSVIRKSGWLKPRVCRSIMQEPMAVSLWLVLRTPQALRFNSETREMVTICLPRLHTCLAFPQDGGCLGMIKEQCQERQCRPEYNPRSTGYPRRIRSRRFRSFWNINGSHSLVL